MRALALRPSLTIFHHTFHFNSLRELTACCTAILLAVTGNPILTGIGLGLLVYFKDEEEDEFFV